MSGNVVKLN